MIFVRTLPPDIPLQSWLAKCGDRVRGFCYYDWLVVEMQARGGSTSSSEHSKYDNTWSAHTRILPSFKKILERRGHSAGNLDFPRFSRKIEISCRMPSSFEYLFKWWYDYVEIFGMKDPRSKFIKCAQLLRKNVIMEYGQSKLVRSFALKGLRCGV